MLGMFWENILLRSFDPYNSLTARAKDSKDGAGLGGLGLRRRLGLPMVNGANVMRAKPASDCSEP